MQLAKLRVCVYSKLCKTMDGSTLRDVLMRENLSFYESINHSIQCFFSDRHPNELNVIDHHTYTMVLTLCMLLVVKNNFAQRGANRAYPLHTHKNRLSVPKTGF